MQPYTRRSGFTYIELLIVIAIISSFAALAYPAYQNFRDRLYFGEINEFLIPYKTAIASCFEQQKTFKGCNAGTHHIPNEIHNAKQWFTELAVVDGVIKVSPKQYRDITSYHNYILTPAVTSDGIQWQSSGEAVRNQFVD